MHTCISSAIVLAAPATGVPSACSNVCSACVSTATETTMKKELAAVKLEHAAMVHQQTILKQGQAAIVKLQKTAKVNVLLLVTTTVFSQQVPIA